jgi:hypothetical protein
VILCKTQGARKAQSIRRQIELRLDLWEDGKFAGLVDDALSEGRAREGRQHCREDTEESRSRRYNSTVMAGKLRAAVRGATNRDGGGVLFPDDVCTKTGLPVLEVLKGQHPDTRTPDLLDPGCKAFEPYTDAPEVVPLDITVEDVERIASRLSGAGGAGGTDAVNLRNWLLRFGASSEELREEMAQWASWLSNSSPPWAAYRATMACRLVALDKCPGTRPVGIGEIYRRLWAKLVLRKAGDQAKTVCGNLQLCAGLEAGIEGAVHAVRRRREE